jgi:hypothetical protein
MKLKSLVLAVALHLVNQNEDKLTFNKGVSMIFKTIFVAVCLLLISTALADVPRMINYQGKLTTPQGALIDTTVRMTFAIYPVSIEGTPLWVETHNSVVVEKGIFSILLGSITSIPSQVFEEKERYLGIKVGDDPETTPRKRIASVGYAYKAIEADLAEWSDTSNYSFKAQNADTSFYAIEAGLAEVCIVEADTDWSFMDTNIYRPTGNVGIGTATPWARLDVVGDVNINSLYKIGGDAVLSTQGTENIFVGVGAGANNTGNLGTFVGDSAGYNNKGDCNVFVGRRAGYSNTYGWWNTFVGEGAGYSNTSDGVYNTFVGWRAGYSNFMGWKNTFLGGLTGYSNLTGNLNVFVGVNAGYSNTIGDRNTFVGKSAGYSNTGGNRNTFLGENAGRSNTTGDSNTFVGPRAGYSNSLGNYNTFLGLDAGYSNTTGNANVFIGYQAGYNETYSNKLYIANSSTSNPLIYGEFNSKILTINGDLGIGTTTPDEKLEVEWLSGGTDAEIGRGKTDTDITFIALRSPNGTKWYIYPDDSGNLVVTTTHP